VKKATRPPLFPRWIVALGAIGLVGLAVYALRSVLTPIAIAFFIAYLLDPLVDRFEKMKIPRALGIVIVLAGAFLVIGLFFVITIPMIVSDLGEFFAGLPEKLALLESSLRPTLESAGIQIPHSVNEAIELLRSQSGNEDVAGTAGTAMGAAKEVLGWVVGGTFSILGAVAGAVVIAVISFYLLYDFDHIVVAIRDLIPQRVRPFVVEVSSEVDQTMSRYIRGQLLVMLILGGLYGILFSIIGVKLAILIGIIAGALSFIPYVGSATALVLALLMCLLDFDGSWSKMLWVVGAYAVIQILDGFLITPKILGGRVGLAAVWVLIALMIGGALFGFLGVLLAVPAAAVAKVFIVRALAWYKGSKYYLSDEPMGPAGVAAKRIIDQVEARTAAARGTSIPPSEEKLRGLEDAIREAAEQHEESVEEGTPDAETGAEPEEGFAQRSDRESDAPAGDGTEPKGKP
jgi:predicted PurR-regulated permease PerM